MPAFFIVADTIKISVWRILRQQLAVEVDIFEQDITVDICLGHEFAVGIVDKVFTGAVWQCFTDTLTQTVVLVGRFEHAAVIHFENAVKEWEAYAEVATSAYRPQLYSRVHHMDWEKILEEVKRELATVKAMRK